VVESSESPLWRAVDRLLAQAEIDGIVAHQLGPLAAYRLEQLGQPVPPELQAQARMARLATVTASPLLRRVRDLVDGPLLLAKGAEIANLYPGRARTFGDLDLLAVEGRALHQALKEDGFVEPDYPEYDFTDYRHLHPLRKRNVWLFVEIHVQPIVPSGYRPPPLAEVVEAAVPSALGVDGISAPHPVHHALMVAAHGWDDHTPLGSLRDLVDVAAVAQQVSERELEQTARRWGMEGIWRTTWRAADALLADRRPSAAVALFGRHLADVRERTVFEEHAQRWLSPFWEFPFRQAIEHYPALLRKELLPDPGEPWSDKFRRAGAGILHPRRPMSSHLESSRRESADDRSAL